MARHLSERYHYDRPAVTPAGPRQDNAQLSLWPEPPSPTTGNSPLPDAEQAIGGSEARQIPDSSNAVPTSATTDFAGPATDDEPPW